MRGRHWALVVLLLAAVASCTGDKKVDRDPCAEGSDCETPGAACVDGYCCQGGAEACACRATGACDLGLLCADGLCSVCATGTEACPCAEGECSDGSICLNEVCADPSCVAGARGCPCTTEGACEVGLCGENLLCVDCAPGVESCPCRGDGTCDGDLSCAAGLCQICEDAKEGCPCGPSDSCEGDLTCRDGTCSSETLTCEDLDCESQGRRCEESPDAHCTTCDPARNFVPDGSGGCAEAPGACTSSSECPAGQSCLRLSTNQPSYCAAIPDCVDLAPSGATGQVWDPDAEQCIECPSCAGVVGSTGQLWPTASADGSRCICETQPGFYFDVALSELRPVACDADGDGWVRSPARQFVGATDIALRENARCDVRSVDHFVLQNERGQRREVSLLELDVVQPTLALYEDVSTDDDDAIGRNEFMPEYGGRRPAARELSPLTKLCVSENADYNANGISDIDEAPRSSVSAAVQPFTRLGYFAELHDGWFEGGAYVIAERPRCVPTFPLGYEAGEGYWRQCTRRRASGFDGGSAPGFDLAEWSCAGSRGSCDLEHVVSLTDGAVDADGHVTGATPGPDGVAAHTACSFVPGADTTAPWLGMGHHSQFQCVKLRTSLPSRAEPYERDLAARGAASSSSELHYDVSTCALGAAASANASGAFPVSVACTLAPASIDDGSVGWASVLYDEQLREDDYRAGCISECRPYLSLCPAYSESSNRAGCASDPGDYGVLSCNLCPQAGLACDKQLPGRCAAGRYICGATGAQTCQEITPAERDDDPLDGEDRDCDGFDGFAGNGIFVDASDPGASDVNEGTIDAPVLTLRRAVDLALGATVTTRVFDLARPVSIHVTSEDAAGGLTYAETRTIELVDGVSIYGGYISRASYGDVDEFEERCGSDTGIDDAAGTPIVRSRWCRVGERTRVELRGVAVGISALAITRPTVVDGLLVRLEPLTTPSSQDPTKPNAGVSIYGLKASTAGTCGGPPCLRFEDVEHDVASDARRTLAGARGAAGDGEVPQTLAAAPAGLDGADGTLPCKVLDNQGQLDCPSGEEVKADSKPAPTKDCGAEQGTTTGGKGGKGGGAIGCTNGDPNDPIRNGERGSSGTKQLPGSTAVTCGAPGDGLSTTGQTTINLMQLATKLELATGKGVTGAATRGTDAQPLAGVDASWHSSAGYSPVSAPSGTHGEIGCGGGGGGGGHGEPNTCTIPGNGHSGGAGASGGTGGCGGDGGLSGLPGGGAFGVYLWNASIAFGDDVVIRVGDGGRGGDAQLGQEGGAGGFGGGSMRWVRRACDPNITTPNETWCRDAIGKDEYARDNNYAREPTDLLETIVQDWLARDKRSIWWLHASGLVKDGDAIIGGRGGDGQPGGDGGHGAPGVGGPSQALFRGGTSTTQGSPTLDEGEAGPDGIVPTP